MNDKKRNLLWQTRIITEVYFFVVRIETQAEQASQEVDDDQMIVYAS